MLRARQFWKERCNLCTLQNGYAEARDRPDDRVSVLEHRTFSKSMRYLPTWWFGVGAGSATYVVKEIGQQDRAQLSYKGEANSELSSRFG